MKTRAKAKAKAKAEVKVKARSASTSTSTSTSPSPSMRRIYLSPPHMSGRELGFVREAFETNWIAPLGPHVDAFEREFAEAVGIPYATGLSSGTAALHLALRILAGDGGWRTEDGGRRTEDHGRSNEVLCSDFTFSATANAIVYEGLVPVFIDCDAASWNMDPNLLHEELAACAKRGKLPRAVIVVDLYGQCADYDPIVAACAEYGVPLIEDAAEALGATYWGKAEADASQRPKAKSQKAKLPDSTFTSASTFARKAGTFGAAAAFSLNGNKVITTGGGGMLVSHEKAITDKARFLATQAREPVRHYQHCEIGFNYRLSNVLAAIGRGQLQVLSERIAARRRNFEFYRDALGDLPGLEFMPEAPYGRCTRWLTCLTIQPPAISHQPSAVSRQPSASVLGLVQALEAENIEARPLWKPMHLQPVFKDCRVRGGGVSERLFDNGLCLPSGSALTEADLKRVCTIVRQTLRATR